MGVFLWATALCGYDICFRRLPNWLTLPAAALTFYLYPMSILGGVLWAALYLRKGIGGGDTKLALSLGTVALASGWLHLFGAIAVASALTVGLCILTRQRSAPHGPSMLIGTGMFTLV